MCTCCLAFPFYIDNLNNYQYYIIFYLLKGFVISDIRVKRIIDLNISKLIDIKSYKGIRHFMCLPVRGQRTRTNAGTQRSKRRKNLI